MDWKAAPRFVLKSGWSVNIESVLVSALRIERDDHYLITMGSQLFLLATLPVYSITELLDCVSSVHCL